MKAYQSVHLDVREDLKNKKEPFKKIMDAVNQLKDDEQLVLHAPFKPKPLLPIMKSKGFTNTVEQKSADHWVVTFKKKEQSLFSSLFSSKPKKQDAQPDQTATPNAASPGADDVDPEIQRSVERDLQQEGKEYRLDNRGLEPPQPMMRTLHQLSRMNSGETLKIRNDRIPVFLFEELQQLGEYEYEHQELEDQSVEITISKN